MAKVGQRVQLVPFEADVAHVVKVVFFIVDVLRLLVSLRYGELLAEVDCEDALVVDLKQDRERQVVSDFLAQRQT